jgi:hypothetical protein
LQRVRENVRSDETLIFYRRLAEPLENPPSEAKGRLATPGDAGRYALDVGTDSPVTFQDRLSEEVMCYVVEEGGRLLHASWVTTSVAWTRELRGYLSPPQGDAYIYESFTRADARGRGLYPLALAGILTEMASRDIRWVWVAVEGSNEPSQRALAKASFEPAFSLDYRRRMGRLHIQPPAGPQAAAAADFLKGVRAGG